MRRFVLLFAVAAVGLVVVGCGSLNTSLPTISRTAPHHFGGPPPGAPAVGDVLFAGSGQWSSSPTGFSYAWDDCDSSGANCSTAAGNPTTGTRYKIVTGDAGSTIRVAVTASFSGHPDSTVMSQPTGVVGGSVGGAAPTNTVGPFFTVPTGSPSACTAGCAVTGQTLGVGTGTWTCSGGCGTLTYAYQWQRCTTTTGQPPTTASCSNITGATSSTYTVQSADQGHALTVNVTASNNGTAGTATKTSGTCDRGWIPDMTLPMADPIDDPGGMVETPSPTAAASGCSPISAVAASTQAGEEFCTNAPTTCGFADPENHTLGVPAGTTLSQSGACAAWASGGTVTTNSTTINGCLIDGNLTINANNVTLENSQVIDGSNDENCAVCVLTGKTGADFENDTINGPHSLDADRGSPRGRSRVLALRSTAMCLRTTSIVFSMMFPDSGTSTVDNSMCWSNGEAGNEHRECIYDGGSANLIAEDDILFQMTWETAVIFTDNPDYGGSGTTGALTMENDLFGGSGVHVLRRRVYNQFGECAHWHGAV